MKKALATILALVMALSVTTYAWADEGVTTAEALNTAVGAGGEVKLGANISATITIPADKTVTLDLNGYSITSAGQVIMNNGKLTITDNKGGGKIVSTGNIAIGVGSNSVTNIQKAIVESVEGAVITGYATGATINIYDGTFSASDNAVIAGNGSDREGAGNTINISGGVFNGKITTSGYVACGIYAPWKDNINVTGGTFNITGGAGIVARAGNVTVTNAVFNTTGNATGKVGDSRVVVPCSAIVFDSQANYPAMNNDSVIHVVSGKFNSEVDAVSMIKNDNETDRVAVTGGTFSSDVSDYVADNTPFAFNERTNEPTYYVGAETIQNAAKNLSAGQWLAIGKGNVTLRDVPAGVIVRPVNDTVGVVVNGKNISGNQYIDGYTVPQSSGYYYYQPTTDTKTTDTKGSPKTFDAGIALYVGMALTSAAGVAFVGKKRED